MTIQKETAYILASASPRRKELLTYLNLSETVQFSVETDETISNEWTPVEAVVRLSVNKGLAVLARILNVKENFSQSTSSTSIISADTIVVRDGQILGKPVDDHDAFHILKSLQGRSHEVYTGLTLLTLNGLKELHTDEQVKGIYDQFQTDVRYSQFKFSSWQPFGEIGHYKGVSQSTEGTSLYCGYIRSKVTFRPLTDDQIIHYVKSGDPLDKAGSYGIQGIGAVNIESIDGDFYSVMGLPLSLLHHLISLSQHETNSKNL